jgi:hypothetical protein
MFSVLIRRPSGQLPDFAMLFEAIEYRSSRPEDAPAYIA